MASDPSKDPSKELPNAADHERSVLSSLFQKPDDLIELAKEEGLSPEQFYVPAHQDLCRFLYELYADSQPIDLVGVSQLLKDKGKLDSMGGPSEISKIYSYSPTDAHFIHHLRSIRAKHVQRETISAATRLIHASYSASSPSEASRTLQDALRELQMLSEGQDSGEGVLSGRDVLTQCYEELEKRLIGKDNPFLETPWSGLNSLLGGGIGLGEISIVAARPSMGKTAFALNLLEHCIMQDIPSLVVSLESVERSLGFRLVSQGSGVDLKRLSRETPTKGDLQAFSESLKTLSGKKWWMQKLHYARHQDVTATIRKAVRQHGVKLVVLDYLQLIKASNDTEQRDMRMRIDNALDAICPLAKQFGLALVILVQLNRDAEGKKGTDLNLSMLKESSRIEQDADLIMMLGTGDHQCFFQDREPRLLVTPKNRDGPTSFVRLEFQGSNTKFYSHIR